MEAIRFHGMGTLLALIWPWLFFSSTAPFLVERPIFIPLLLSIPCPCGRAVQVSAGASECWTAAHTGRDGTSVVLKSLEASLASEHKTFASFRGRGVCEGRHQSVVNAIHLGLLRAKKEKSHRPSPQAGPVFLKKQCLKDRLL